MAPAAEATSCHNLCKKMSDADCTYLLIARVINLLLQVHFVTTLTNVFTFAKIIYKGETFPGLPLCFHHHFFDLRVSLKITTQKNHHLK
jgi:hypothetical protein